jgi:hypothetical protein
MERAWLATEPLVRLLYLFFALEALLGDTGESLKAAASSRFGPPSSVERLAGLRASERNLVAVHKVRSAPVQGSERPAMSDHNVGRLASDVREALA